MLWISRSRSEDAVVHTLVSTKNTKVPYSERRSEDDVHNTSALADRFVHAMQQGYAFTASLNIRSLGTYGIGQQ